MTANRVKVRPFELRLPKAPDLLAEHIRDGIVAGTIPPGATLPSESELASQLGVSRPTVREALHILEVEGLVTIKPGPKGGAIVRTPNYETVTRLLAFTLRYQRTTLAELIEIRKVIEPWCAQQAALRASDEEFEVLRASVERGEAQIEDPAVFIAENRNFHITIAKAAGNRVAALFVSSLRDLAYESVVVAELDSDSRRSSIRAHRRVFEALSARDAERAAAEMVSHLVGFDKRLVAMFGDLSTRLLSDKLATPRIFEIERGAQVDQRGRPSGGSDSFSESSS